MKRVRCLYRVSTVKQLDKNDIPMQRIECRKYIDQMPDWKFDKEYIEKGKIKTFEEYKEKYKKEMHNPDLLERNMPLGVNVKSLKDKGETR